MLFGNMLNLDRGIFVKYPERLVQNKPLSNYTIELLSIQDNLLEASAKELLRTDLLHMTMSEQNKHIEYEPDSYVLVHYRTGSPPTRLHTYWRGPMRVANGLNSKYVLLDLLSGKEKVFHVSDMKPFVFDPAVVDPLDIARRDYMEYFIDEILDHRGNIKKRSTLEYHVSWLGDAQESNTWEPYLKIYVTLNHSILTWLRKICSSCYLQKNHLEKVI